MTTKEFENFKVSVNLSIELDCVMRSITEKLKLIHQSNDKTALRNVIQFLRETDDDIYNLIKLELCKDATED